MAEERDSNSNTTVVVVKLLITSVDCDPKAELRFSDGTLVNWNSIVDALNKAKYYFAMSRLPPRPPSSNLTTSKNPGMRNSGSKVAFLSLQASKKVAFLYSDGVVQQQNYQITYDKSLMNDLPSFCNLKGLPRFHLFTSLPDDLQLHILKYLDGVGFAKMRCVSHRFSRLRWNRTFNILNYSHPNTKAEKSKKKNEESFVNNAFLIRIAAVVCIAAVVYGVFTNVRSGARLHEYDDEE